MNIIDEVKEGKEIDIEYFLNIIKYFKDNDCDNVILGCTELSILRDNFNLNEYYVDPVEVVSREIILRSGKEVI